MDILALFPSWLLPAVLILFFTCIFMYTLRWKSSSMAASKLPPSPMRLPIIGNLHQVQGKDMHQTLWKLSQKYGPIMLLHFGAQPTLIVSSTEMASQVLKTHDHVFCTRPYSKATKRLTFNYMDVAFSPHGDHWRDMRKVLVSEFLGVKRTKLFKDVMEAEMEGLVHSLSLHSISSTPVNLDDKLLHLVTDVVCKVALGKSYRENAFRGKKLRELLDDEMAMLGGSLSDVFPIFGWILDGLTGWNGKLEKCFSDFDGFLQMVLDEHLNRNESNKDDHEKDLVDACISRLSSDEMKGILMNVLNGAIDTSATTMVWAMSEIVKNPRVMQMLQDEIRSCTGKKAHELDITKMTYLKMVVKETLRLHPPSPFLLTRECISHCQIGGYDVFPGTKVIINAWGIGRDPRTWKERPTEFSPERFEDVQVDFVGKHFEMIPFGGGKRACPGYNSAISTIEFTLANLLYWFNWETPGGVKNEDLDMEEEASPLVHKKTPLWLVPKKSDLQD